MSNAATWRWDQGRLEYFQFDSIRAIAGFVCNHDFKTAEPGALKAAIGLPFKAPKTHSPWRNYSRILKLCLLISEHGGKAIATPLARLLAEPGIATCDEYFHFLARSFTQPSPALKEWDADVNPRYPLLFSLRYLLAKGGIQRSSGPVAASVDLTELIGAYGRSGFSGGEEEEAFCTLLRESAENDRFGKSLSQAQLRQPRESLMVLAQISYLHYESHQLQLSLNWKDACDVFKSLSPIGGSRCKVQDAELRRISALFTDFISEADELGEFEYPFTKVGEAAESGFEEGSRVQRSHITVERNSNLRRRFFQTRNVSECDVCGLKTADTYPWTERVLDLHHLLPLSSGTRVEQDGTTFSDLVPVCPSCHRAVHRYYSVWLEKNCRKDFENKDEAVQVYSAMKGEFPGLQV